jgi:hypothetical protein
MAIIAVLIGLLFPAFKRSAKPSQTSAGEKRSHPNRQRGECVIYRVWESIHFDGQQPTRPRAGGDSNRVKR